MSNSEYTSDIFFPSTTSSNPSIPYILLLLYWKPKILDRNTIILELVKYPEFKSDIKDNTLDLDSIISECGCFPCSNYNKIIIMFDVVIKHRFIYKLQFQKSKLPGDILKKIDTSSKRVNHKLPKQKGNFENNEIRKTKTLKSQKPEPRKIGKVPTNPKPEIAKKIFIKATSKVESSQNAPKLIKYELVEH
ncbi:hypothetical protein DLAC_04155 [Tieghemostelium lacteum]|uniref:Uncharacterized protein n=1 Tax=Tieghemostelium lacteum TaxID=361077 RepID=A0A151ZSD8_TIELA|nr:hypothetical protein DLAC_04155 [Tieghemostelium lacteum]|eukprot:KYQ96849.1 hypothetical protein DLAC_04155 [Tieghemostelium lacteum]